MRTKPLNKPNSMGMIMENWRKFTGEAQKVLPCGPPGKLKLFLFENNSSTPTSEVLIDSLIEDCENELINEEQLFNYIDESFEYEYQQLLEEGFIDMLKAPAKSEIAIKAKFKIKQKLANFVARIFSAIVKSVQFLVDLIGKAEKGLLSTVGKAKDGKINQNAIVKIYESTVSKVGSAVKKIGGLGKRIVVGILKFFNYPLFKAAVIVACLGILIVSFFTTTLFVGALAAAPLWASRRLGFKGAMTFWKSIPNVEAGAMAENLDLSQNENGPQLLTEVSEEILSQALAFLASDIPEGTEEVVTIVSHGEYITDYTAAGDAAEIDFTWIEYADKELSTQLSAINDLQMELDPTRNPGIDFDELMTYSGEIRDQTLKTLQTALRIAEKTCATDPAICEASTILAEEFEMINHTSIMSETVMASKSLSVNGDVEEAWHAMANSSYSRGGEHVVSNPFHDPEEYTRRPGEAATYTRDVRHGTSTLSDTPGGARGKAARLAKSMGQDAFYTRK